MKVVGPNNSRQQDKGKGSVRGGGGAVLDNNLEEAGGHWVKLFLPGAVDGEQAGTEEREKSLVVKRARHGGRDAAIKARRDACNGMRGTGEGDAGRILGLVVPDPVVAGTDVRAACATAKRVGEVGQLKRH